ncbi:FeoB-associated Cys-rich membrane protein [Clostridium sp. CT7]|nr:MULTISPECIES: FeoB-associated Cys-rich membrane protein [Clostridium]PJI07339.1 FeoB-associated Cys-rich membrane protein [Clostridium sp. CT7]
MLIEILLTILIICSAIYIFYKSFKKGLNGDCSSCCNSKTCNNCCTTKKQLK